jgi:2-methylcitrate dehydratase PrpD
MGATAILAQFAAETSGQRIPSEARTIARDHLLDGVGVALAASVEPPGRIVVELAREAGGREEAHLLWTDLATSALQAAWANGALGHLLDFDDTGPSHPTACVLPAVLATAERVGASGSELLAAMVVGYEVFLRLSAAAHAYEARLRGRGYHPTSIYGCPAAAAAAGRVGLGPGPLNGAKRASSARTTAPFLTRP